MKVFLITSYLMTIVLANWALSRFGVVPIGFGLMAPAGVFFAGIAFTLRDGIHSLHGAKWVWLAIAGGTAASLLISPAFAVASGVAFAISELCDFAVYSPLRKKSWPTAVFFSNTVGAVVDSALFLWLAFGSLAFIEGQIVGKLMVTIATIAVVAAIRSHYLSQRQRVGGVTSPGWGDDDQHDGQRLARQEGLGG